MATIFMTWVKVKNDLLELRKYSVNRTEFSNDKGKNLSLGRITSCKNYRTENANLGNGLELMADLYLACVLLHHDI